MPKKNSGLLTDPDTGLEYHPDEGFYGPEPVRNFLCPNYRYCQDKIQNMQDTERYLPIKRRTKFDCAGCPMAEWFPNGYIQDEINEHDSHGSAMLLNRVFFPEMERPDRRRHNGKERIKMVGKVFGRWTVLDREPAHKGGEGGNLYWWCECECGTVRLVLGRTLRDGTSQSCGCLRAEELNKAGNI